MKIAVIDADLIGRVKHNFPNLSCMKISGYYKKIGAAVELKTDYDNLREYDKVYIAKVFTDTPIPRGGLFGNILDFPNVEFGGTGFDFTKNKNLPYEIEHAMPDYHLYEGICTGKNYTDYSIGFLTRGCFRHCPFCVNRNSNKVEKHSPLSEFVDSSRPKICLLDDNFLGYTNWKKELQELTDTGKPFTFKQGLDVRLLNEEKATLLFQCKYDGDYIFAFDNIRDAPLIEEKLKLIRRHTKKRVKFYVLCGYDRLGKYDENFFENDLKDLFERIKILLKYDALPFVMKHEDYKKSPYKEVYKAVARWCNQVHIFWKMSFSEFVAADRKRGAHYRFGQLPLEEYYFTMKRGN